MGVQALEKSARGAGAKVARPPRWMKFRFTGKTTPTGNVEVELCIKWWAVPFLFLKGLVTRRYEPPMSCDGMEITSVKFGKCQREGK